MLPFEKLKILARKGWPLGILTLLGSHNFITCITCNTLNTNQHPELFKWITL